MVERFFDHVWERIGTILQDRGQASSSLVSRPTAAYDLEMQTPDTVLDFDPVFDDEEQQQQRQNEEEQQEDVDDPVARMSDHDFIKDYSAFLYAHYGRPPRYMTDLFCCMSPIMVEMSNDHTGVPTLHRWWWLPINHPLVVRMQAFHEPNCGQVSAGFCGSFVIYGDTIIVKWVRELGRLFSTQLGQDLEVAQKPEPVEPAMATKEKDTLPSPPMTRSVQVSAAPLMPEKAAAPLVPPEERPPVIRMSVQSVSNKKGD